MAKVFLCVLFILISVIKPTESIAYEKFDVDLYITDHPDSKLAFNNEQFYIFTYSDPRTPQNSKPSSTQTKKSIAQIKSSYNLFIQFINSYPNSKVSRHILSMNIAIRLHNTTAASMALGGYLDLADGTEYIAVDIYTGASSEIIVHELAHSITHLDFMNNELSETVADLVALKTHDYITYIPTGVHQDISLYRELAGDQVFKLYQEICQINEFQFRSFTQKLTNIDLLKIEIEADYEPHMLSCYYLSNLHNSSKDKTSFNRTVNQIINTVMSDYFDIYALSFNQLLELSTKKATQKVQP